MSWGAVAGAAVGLVGSAISNRGARRGADAQQQAALAATEESRRQFDITRQDLMPWMDAGRGALDSQQSVLRGDYSGFMNSPDYLYARDASLQALDRGAAARGGFMGGGADADRIQLAGGLATQNLGNYWNKLAGMSGTGQQTATDLGQFGADFANQAGNNLFAGANARASSYAAQANNWNQALNKGYGAFAQKYGWNS